MKRTPHMLRLLLGDVERRMEVQRAMLDGLRARGTAAHPDDRYDVLLAELRQLRRYYRLDKLRHEYHRCLRVATRDRR